MNSDKAKGKVREFAGRTQRTVGKLTGNRKTQVKGALRQVAGRLQQAEGEVREQARVAARKSRARREGAGRSRTTTRTRTVRTRARTTRDGSN